MRISIEKDKLNEVIEKMCDDYCYFAAVSHDQDVLDKHCEECPLNNIDEIEYPLGKNDWQE